MKDYLRKIKAAGLATMHAPLGPESGKAHTSVLASTESQPADTNLAGWNFVWALEQYSTDAGYGEFNDEPDANPPTIGTKTVQLQAQYDLWHPSAPVWLNLSGADFLDDTNTVARGNPIGAPAVYDNIFTSMADIISVDLYPWNVDWATYPHHVNSTVGMASVHGAMLDKLRTQLASLSVSKPTMAFIQVGPVSDHDKGGAVGPEDVRNQMWNVIIHGGYGILLWIANCSEKFVEDVPLENYDELKANAQVINSFSSVLTDQIIEPTTLGPEDGIGIGTIHVGGRTTSSGRYYVVQNISKSASWSGAIPLSGVGNATNATVYTMPASWPTTFTLTATPCTNCISGGSISQTLAANTFIIIAVDQ